MDEQRVRMIEGSLVSSIERAMRRMDEQDPLTWAQVTLLLCESLAVLRDSRLGLELPAEAEEPLILGQGG